MKYQAYLEYKDSGVEWLGKARRMGKAAACPSIMRIGVDATSNIDGHVVPPLPILRLVFLLGATLEKVWR
jgi:hypothetical protein